MVNEAREALEQREDGGWYRQCGCRFDYWDGRPRELGYENETGREALLGRVSPHIHVCDTCAQQQHASGAAGAVQELQAALEPERLADIIELWVNEFEEASPDLTKAERREDLADWISAYAPTSHGEAEFCPVSCGCGCPGLSCHCPASIHNKPARCGCDGWKAARTWQHAATRIEALERALGEERLRRSETVAMCDQLQSERDAIERVLLRELADIRDVLLGNEGEPLYEKWLANTVGDPAAIKELAKDVMRSWDDADARSNRLSEENSRLRYERDRALAEAKAWRGLASHALAASGRDGKERTP